MKMITRVLALATLLLPLSAMADVVVVGSKNVGLDNLSQNDVKQLFLGTNNVINGKVLTPIDLPADTKSRDNFYANVVGKSAAQMRSHWAKMTFTGKGTPPKTASSAQELRVLMARTGTNVIGYIDESEVTGEMVVLFKK